MTVRELLDRLAEYDDDLLVNVDGDFSVMLEFGEHYIIKGGKQDWPISVVEINSLQYQSTRRRDTLT